MSAEMLRRAATELHGEWSGRDGDAEFRKMRDFHFAVSDWLEVAAHEADELESLGLTYGGERGRPALAVARAYLGEAAPVSRYGSRCEDCQRCTNCPETAYCLSEPGTRPCSHDNALCEECRLEECVLCRVEAGLAAAWEKAGGAFDGPGEDPDPLGPLAAEEHAKTERFWSTVGDRSHLTRKDPA